MKIITEEQFNTQASAQLLGHKQPDRSIEYYIYKGKKGAEFDLYVFEDNGKADTFYGVNFNEISDNESDNELIKITWLTFIVNKPNK